MIIKKEMIKGLYELNKVEDEHKHSPLFFGNGKIGACNKHAVIFKLDPTIPSTDVTEGEYYWVMPEGMLKTAMNGKTDLEVVFDKGQARLKDMKTPLEVKNIPIQRIFTKDSQPFELQFSIQLKVINHVYRAARHFGLKWTEYEQVGLHRYICYWQGVPGWYGAFMGFRDGKEELAKFPQAERQAELDLIRGIEPLF